MTKEKTTVLNAIQIDQKLTRMAHEILEKNYKEKEIVIIGISGNGTAVAQRLSGILESISELSVSSLNIEIDKQKPVTSSINVTGDKKLLKGKNLIVVDDVLNSGKTMMYAAASLLEVSPKSIAVATLIERSHRTFPVRADFVGLTLSTNLKEHVTVEMNGKNEEVYLE